MDIDETVTAILRTFHEKALTAPERASELLAETHQRIMLVYYTAFSQTNDILLEYLPPLELSE